ncbi:hypothetical protein V8D89_001013 [Ganoderma adspersum]
MRLLDTCTGQFVEKEPRDKATTYAILSHTWDSSGAQTQEELKEIQKRYPPNPLPLHAAEFDAPYVCYAYLADVPADEDHSKDVSSFHRSRWFTRDWTLQELLAPPHLVFLSKDWTVLGSKPALAELAHDITKVTIEALLLPDALHTFSVAQRLSWAIRRAVADHAYSLLGIFGIYRPTLYCEA